MKKILALLTALALLLSMAAGGALAEDWTDYTCAEESFSLRVPDGAAVTYEEGTGLMIYTEHAGKIPYAIVSRRPMNMKFTNPGGYLNNVYREHLEEKYGSDFLGMNPASMMEVGGKQLPGAKYMYKVGEYTVVLLKLLDIRDAGDVEYTIKYVYGDDLSVIAAVNEAVRTYQETDVPAAAGRTEQPETQKAVLRPAEVSEDTADTENGNFWVRIMNEHKIDDGGYFTADLYEADTYSLQDVNSLQEGDQIQMIGKVWTVSALLPEENGYRELRVKEEFDGYFAFQPVTETTCTLVVNDWVASTPVGRKKIMLPLPDAFACVKLESSGDQTVYDAESFIELLLNGDAKNWTRYNTLISFSDGLAAYVIHADYPEGPSEDAEAGWAEE